MLADQPTGTPGVASPRRVYDHGQQCLPFLPAGATPRPYAGAAPDPAARLAAQGRLGPDADAVIHRALSGCGGTLAPGDSLSLLIAQYVADDLGTIPLLRGCYVRDVADAAALLACLRSPLVERFGWLATDPTGRVIANGLWSIGSSCEADAPDTAELDRLVQELGLVPGTTMTWAHNHPSGDPHPSNADQALYARMHRELEARGRHFTGIVLNGHRFALFNGPGHFSEGNAYAGGTTFHHHEPTTCAQILTPEAAADWMKSLQTSPGLVVAAHVNAHRRIIGVDAWQNRPSLDLVVDGRRRCGATSSVLLGPSTLANHTWDTGVDDVVLLAEDGSFTSERREWRIAARVDRSLPMQVVDLRV